MSINFKASNEVNGKIETRPQDMFFVSTDSLSINLDADNSSGANKGNYQVSYTENAPAIPVCDSDVEVKGVISEIVVLQINYNAAEDRHALLTLPASIGGVLSAGTITLTAPGDVTAEDWQNALLAIRYDNTSDAPALTDRTFHFSVAGSLLAASAITVMPVDDIPTVDLDGDNSTTPGSNYLTTYEEAGTPVAICDVDTLVLDVDSASIVSATVQLTNPQIGDVLNPGTPPAGISAIYANNIVTFSDSGSGEFADFETAIEGVLFNNTEFFADRTQRVISVKVINALVSNEAQCLLDIIDNPTMRKVFSNGQEGSDWDAYDLNNLRQFAGSATIPFWDGIQIGQINDSAEPTNYGFKHFRQTTGAKKPAWTEDSVNFLSAVRFANDSSLVSLRTVSKSNVVAGITFEKLANPTLLTTDTIMTWGSDNSTNINLRIVSNILSIESFHIEVNGVDRSYSNISSDVVYSILIDVQGTSVTIYQNSVVIDTFTIAGTLVFDRLDIGADLGLEMNVSRNFLWADDSPMNANELTHSLNWLEAGKK